MLVCHRCTHNINQVLCVIVVETMRRACEQSDRAMGI